MRNCLFIGGAYFHIVYSNVLCIASLCCFIILERFIIPDCVFQCSLYCRLALYFYSWKEHNSTLYIPMFSVLQACVEAFHYFIAIDSDSVWLLLNDVYCPHSPLSSNVEYLPVIQVRWRLYTDCDFLESMRYTHFNWNSRSQVPGTNSFILALTKT